MTSQNITSTFHFPFFGVCVCVCQCAPHTIPWTQLVTYRRRRRRAAKGAAETRESDIFPRLLTPSLASLTVSWRGEGPFCIFDIYFIIKYYKSESEWIASKWVVWEREGSRHWRRTVEVARSDRKDGPAPKIIFHFWRVRLTSEKLSNWSSWGRSAWNNVFPSDEWNSWWTAAWRFIKEKFGFWKKSDADWVRTQTSGSNRTRAFTNWAIPAIFKRFAKRVYLRYCEAYFVLTSKWRVRFSKKPNN